MAPFTASTNTTRPTSDITYLANRPSRRNQILSLTAIIQTLRRLSTQRQRGLPAARHAPAASMQTAGRPREGPGGGTMAGNMAGNMERTMAGTKLDVSAGTASSIVRGGWPVSGPVGYRRWG